MSANRRRAWDTGAAAHVLGATLHADSIAGLLARGGQVRRVAARAGISTEEAIRVGTARGLAYDPKTERMIPGKTSGTPARPGAAGTSGETWTARALCTEADPDAWFSDDAGDTAEAKKVCARCPVRTRCLDYAIEHDEKVGVWGGLSEDERRDLQRRAA